MTQTVPNRLAPGTTMSLHGFEPGSALPVTWHVTPLADDGAPGTYLVEQADGDIRSPALWMQAQRAARLAGEAEVLELIRRVVFDRTTG